MINIQVILDSNDLIYEAFLEVDIGFESTLPLPQS